MTTLPSLPDAAFAKLDATPDPLFYAQPRFVTHIDDDAIDAVTDVYRATLPQHGVVLDLMSSWVSHLPAEHDYAAVIGHGLNADELAANPRLTRWFVQDLNANATLPLDAASVDAVTICVSIQYLQRPVAVLSEVRRVLRARGVVVITFSNRCFPTKAIALWHRLDGSGRAGLVRVYLEHAGFAEAVAHASVPEGRGRDPLYCVVGR